MAARFVGLLVVGWLCFQGSLAGLASVSAQATPSQPATKHVASSKSNTTQTQLIEGCRANKRCALLETDGSAPDAPALFLAAVTNEDVDTIVLAASRYTLSVPAWARFKDNPYVLRNNLTVLSAGKC